MGSTDQIYQKYFQDIYRFLLKESNIMVLLLQDRQKKFYLWKKLMLLLCYKSMKQDFGIG
nr:hypothetical protein [Gracilibacillus saliphilus]